MLYGATGSTRIPAIGDAIAGGTADLRLAFIAALQHLPPRQRAVLILREVLCWKAAEVAELLGTTVASVNSALQRARATLAAQGLDRSGQPAPVDDAHRELLARYVDAFERYDMSSLVTVLHEDAVQAMPPYALWLRGTADITAWMLGVGIACKGSRLLPVQANGSPAFAQYKPSADGVLRPWALQVLTVQDGLITGMVFFLDTARVFPLFGLPDHLPA